MSALGSERLRGLQALPWLTLALLALAALARFALPSPLALAYAPAAPSLLRLLGCHFAHFSHVHFVWDALTFGALGTVSEFLHRGRYAAFLLAAALVVPPLACALEPWVEHYAGLSGLVIGQVGLALAIALRSAIAPRTSLWMAVLLLLLFGKQLYEYRTGDTSLITLRYQGFSTVPGAHLVSAAVGALVGLAPYLVRNATKTQHQSKSATTDTTTPVSAARRPPTGGQALGFTRRSD